MLTFWALKSEIQGNWAKTGGLEGGGGKWRGGGRGGCGRLKGPRDTGIGLMPFAGHYIDFIYLHCVVEEYCIFEYNLEKNTLNLTLSTSAIPALAG